MLSWVTAFLSVGGIAFQGCVSLRSIVMPQSLEVMEGLAFENCASLTDIYFLGDMPDFGDNIFSKHC